jgi:hypothetical protein
VIAALPADVRANLPLPTGRRFIIDQPKQNKAMRMETMHKRACYRLMRLLLFFSFPALFSFYANGQTISLRFQAARITTVFTSIEQQSDFRFVPLLLSNQ